MNSLSLHTLIEWSNWRQFKPLHFPGSGCAGKATSSECIKLTLSISNASLAMNALNCQLEFLRKFNYEIVGCFLNPEDIVCYQDQTGDLLREIINLFALPILHLNWPICRNILNHSSLKHRAVLGSIWVGCPSSAISLIKCRQTLVSTINGIFSPLSSILLTFFL